MARASSAMRPTSAAVAGRLSSTSGELPHLAEDRVASAVGRLVAAVDGCALRLQLATTSRDEDAYERRQGVARVQRETQWRVHEQLDRTLTRRLRVGHDNSSSSPRPSFYGWRRRAPTPPPRDRAG